MATQKLRNDSCIVCGKKDKTIRRGLCVTHYQQFIDAYNAAPKQLREQWERKEIEAKHVLPAGHGGRPAAKNPFAESLARLIRQTDSQLAIDELSTADTPPSDVPPRKFDKPARSKKTEKHG